jgi:hypothetical protein
VVVGHHNSRNALVHCHTCFAASQHCVYDAGKVVQGPEANEEGVLHMPKQKKNKKKKKQKQSHRASEQVPCCSCLPAAASWSMP